MAQQGDEPPDDLLINLELFLNDTFDLDKLVRCGQYRSNDQYEALRGCAKSSAMFQELFEFRTLPKALKEDVLTVLKQILWEKLAIHNVTHSNPPAIVIVSEEEQLHFSWHELANRREHHHDTFTKMLIDTFLEEVANI